MIDVATFPHGQRISWAETKPPSRAVTPSLGTFSTRPQVPHSARMGSPPAENRRSGWECSSGISSLIDEWMISRNRRPNEKGSAADTAANPKNVQMVACLSPATRVRPCEDSGGGKRRVGI
jgi:hypothetical protein